MKSNKTYKTNQASVEITAVIYVSLWIKKNIYITGVLDAVALFLFQHILLCFIPRNLTLTKICCIGSNKKQNKKKNLSFFTLATAFLKSKLFFTSYPKRNTVGCEILKIIDYC